MPDYVHSIVNRIVVDVEIDTDSDRKLHPEFYSDLDCDDIEFEFEEVRWCDLGPPNWNDTSNSTESTCPDCIQILNAPIDIRSYICYWVLPHILSFFTFHLQISRGNL